MGHNTDRKNTRAIVQKKPSQPLKPQNQGSAKQESKTDSKTKEPREYTINTNDIVINSKITTKDIRDSLWRCRDFELSHLWQRSIFLTTILILCFTGYGVVTMKLCEQVEIDVNSSVYVLNNIALVLCIINIMFSSLWIMMAKGSKAWYERYERAIDAFECDKKYSSSEVISTGVNESEIGGFQFQNLTSYDRPDVRDCIFSCKGGGYSPSKINIAIGQISFVLWCFAFGVHSFLSFKDFCLDERWIKKIIPLLLLFVVVIILRAFYFNKF